MKTTYRTSTLVALSLIACSFELSCGNKSDNCETTSSCPPDATAGKPGTTSKVGGASNRGGTTGSTGGAPSQGGSISGGGNSAILTTGGTPTSGGGTATSAGASSIAGAAGSTSTVPCDGKCSGLTPLCDNAANKCVGCLSGTDCTADASKPYCNLTAQTCVACRTSDDCKDPKASRCDTQTNTCGPCSIDTDCNQIAGKGICATGACVQCTGKKYDACGKTGDGKALVCDSLKSVCTTDKTVQSADLCQPCLSDAQCKPGEYCLQQTYKGQPVGQFCFWKQGDTANGAPAKCYSDAGRPYVSTPTATSLDGETATFCTLRTSTCPAMNQFSAKNCASTGTPTNTECGVSPGEDSKCAETSPGSGAYRCTTACASADDCNAGFDCIGSVPKFCSLDPATASGGTTGTGGATSTGFAGAAGR